MFIQYKHIINAFASVDKSMAGNREKLKIYSNLCKAIQFEGNKACEVLFEIGTTEAITTAFDLINNGMNYDRFITSMHKIIDECPYQEYQHLLKNNDYCVKDIIKHIRRIDGKLTPLVVSDIIASNDMEYAGDIIEYVSGEFNDDEIIDFLKGMTNYNHLGCRDASLQKLLNSNKISDKVKDHIICHEL